MSNSRKKTPPKKRPVISQKHLIILIAAAVALVVILIIAFSGPKNTPDNNPANATPVRIPQGEEAAELVAASPGRLLILCDIELTLGYDQNGKVIALTGDSDPARTVAGECDIVGKTCAEAMAVILPKLEGERLQRRTFITIRQEQIGVNPGEAFMDAVNDAAIAATDVPVVVIGVDDMDIGGYFDQNMAKRCIRAALGDHAEILRITGMSEGRYVATIKLDEVTQDYAISALTGTTTVYGNETPSEPIPDEMFIESFVTPSDNPNENPELGSAPPAGEETPAA